MGGVQVGEAVGPEEGLGPGHLLAARVREDVPAPRLAGGADLVEAEGVYGEAEELGAVGPKGLGEVGTL